MGVINATPDSFSGDGLGSDIPAIVDRALLLEAEGADIIDLGAESTRPGSSPVSVDTELSRLIPALGAILARVSIPVSVDTYKAEVARQAIDAGATMINDVWGLKADPDMARAAANAGVSVVLMHNQEKAQYRDLVADVRASLANSVSIALRAGVPEDRIIIDPGIGFGKTPEHNLEILQRLREFKSLGYPLLVGPSRKSTIGLLLELPPDQRVEGTAAMVALSIAGGADLVRVHDVKEMSRVSRVSDAVIRGWRPEGWDR
jgi:dihydropteroate synthase